MKQITLIMLGVMALGQSYAQTNYPSGVSSCIARWNFTNSGGTIAQLGDSSGNNRHGGTYNLSTANGYRNAFQKAMAFNGTSSYAEIAHHASLNPQEITIVALVKPQGFYSGNCQASNIIYKSYAYYNSGCWGMMLTDASYDNDCNVYSPNNFQLSFAGSAVPTGNMPSGNYISTNKWYLFVTTYNGYTLKRYQILMDTSAHAGTIAPISTTNYLTGGLGSNTYNVRIGATQNPPFPFWFNGAMDEIALFNRALGDNEVRSIYEYLWGKVFLTAPLPAASYCGGEVFNLHYKVADNHPSNNVFTAQLSDPNGNFNNPVTIGTASTNAAGYIVCTIPANVAPGTGYRVRIVPSNAVMMSDDNGTNIQIMPGLVPAVTINSNTWLGYVPGQQMTFNAVVTNGGMNPSYQWRKNGQDIPGATASTYTTSNLAVYDKITVLVDNNDPCAKPDTAVSTAVNLVPTSIAESENHAHDLKLIPNPTNGSFVVRGFPQHAAQADVRILGLLGQMVYQLQVPLSNGAFTEPLLLPATLANGPYLIQIQSEGQSGTLRFTLQK